MSEERRQAMRIANRLLDEPYADPDDDYRVLARQFNRQTELVMMLVHNAGGRIELSAQDMMSFSPGVSLEMWRDAARDVHILQLRPSAG